jgi:formiminotetrahydrofolate cyclodeaminase
MICLQKKKKKYLKKINENKLSISRAIRNMDAIIDSLSEEKKSLHSKVNEDKKIYFKIPTAYTNSSCTC